jgi:hypothetical protein
MQTLQDISQHTFHEKTDEKNLKTKLTPTCDGHELLAQLDPPHDKRKTKKHV